LETVVEEYQILSDQEGYKPDVGPDISMVNEYTCSERRAYDCSLGMALKNQKSCMAAIIGSASLTTSCHTSHCQTAHSKIFPLIIA
jgi:hypothetical protein